MIARAVTPLPASAAPSFREAQIFFDNTVFRWAMGFVLVAMAASAGWLAWQGDGGTGASVLAWTVVLAVLIGRLAIVSEVDEDALRVRLWPFPTKTYAWGDIESAEVRTYKPLREYGGWGIRFGPSGLAWNAYGDQGVQLVFTSGKRVLIGSQRAEELAAAIRARLPPRVPTDG